MACSMNSSPNEVYHVSKEQKLRAKKAAQQFKYGSPKLRDTIRERCRSRMKEARHSAFGAGRGLGSETFIKRVVLEEIAELESDLNLQELIYQEIAEESIFWFLEELENGENYLIEMESARIVFCPVCQKSKLTKNEKKLTCVCGIKIDYIGSVEQFGEQINEIIRKHESVCLEKCDIFTEPIGNLNQITLTILCDNCGFYSHVQ